MQVTATTTNYVFEAPFLDGTSKFTVPAKTEKEAREKLEAELTKILEEIKTRPR